MDVHDYEYIVAIAEQGSITRAAAQLFITQSALTKFLQRTEKNLGLPLFQRHGNQFLLTEIGREYVETGRSIMQLDRQLTARLDEELNAQKKVIRLGYSMGWTSYLFEEIFPLFYSRFSDVRIRTHADTSRKHMEGLQKGDIDLALLTNIPPLPGYTYIPMSKSYLAILVPENSPLLNESQPKDGYKYPTIPFNSIKDLPYVFTIPTTNSGNMAREFFRIRKHTPRVVLEVGDIRSLFDAVENGLGIAICMTTPLGKRKLRYLSPEDTEPIQQTTMISYRTDKSLTAPMKHLITLLLKGQ